MPMPVHWRNGVGRRARLPQRDLLDLRHRHGRRLDPGRPPLQRRQRSGGRGGPCAAGGGWAGGLRQGRLLRGLLQRRRHRSTGATPRRSAVGTRRRARFCPTADDLDSDVRPPPSAQRRRRAIHWPWKSLPRWGNFWVAGWRCWSISSTRNGSFWAASTRQQRLLEPIALRVLQAEALAPTLAVCRIVPAALGEQIGDYASLSVARYALDGG